MMNFRLGDSVTIERHTDPIYDGTVVDVIDPRADPPLLRVYWRYPLGKVEDHHASELRAQ